ncbi:MAG TPA: hypothetical protein VG406_21100 [Isosphaeraceae bacterium]|jgi:hypothetical protein|nr:hypothetical protein [Isosphaeraceae bacterium]
MIDPRPMVLVVCLLGDAGPTTARVTVEGLEVLDATAASAFETGQLREGDRVVVRGVKPGGWLAIEPPRGSFGWIDQEDIEVIAPGRARVVAARSAVRSGNPEARLPGPPRKALARGAVVRLQDRRPLRLRRGDAIQVWRAIEPPEGTLAYVRADGVQGRFATPPRPPRASRPEPPLNSSRHVILGLGVEDGDEGPPVATRPKAGTPRKLARARVAPQPAPAPKPKARPVLGPRATAATLPAAVEAALKAIEERHRATLRGPIATWDWQLGPIADEYKGLLARVGDSAADAVLVLRGRIDEVARQREAARAAVELKALLDRSRRRDGELQSFRDRLAKEDAPTVRPFDATGLLQPSSKLVDGEKVYALIAADGTTFAYLDLPPGLPADGLIARRVGVRGDPIFEPTLQARLFRVRDLEMLPDQPDTAGLLDWELR